jgi:hypothetical protein
MAVIASTYDQEEQNVFRDASSREHYKTTDETINVKKKKKVIQYASCLMNDMHIILNESK